MIVRRSRFAALIWGLSIAWHLTVAPPASAADDAADTEAVVAHVEAAISPSFVIEGEPVATPTLTDRTAELEVHGVLSVQERSGLRILTDN